MFTTGEQYKEDVPCGMVSTVDGLLSDGCVEMNALSFHVELRERRLGLGHFSVRAEKGTRPSVL